MWSAFLFQQVVSGSVGVQMVPPCSPTDKLCVGVCVSSCLSYLLIWRRKDEFFNLLMIWQQRNHFSIIFLTKLPWKKGHWCQYPDFFEVTERDKKREYEEYITVPLDPIICSTVPSCPVLMLLSQPYCTADIEFTNGEKWRETARHLSKTHCSTNPLCSVLTHAFGYLKIKQQENTAGYNTKESAPDGKRLNLFYVVIFCGKWGKFYKLSKR